MTLPPGLSLWLFYGCVLIGMLAPLIPRIVRRDDRAVDVMPPILLALSFSCLAYVAWFLDAWAGLSAHWMFVGVFAAWGACLALLFARGRRARPVMALTAIYFVGLVAMHFADTCPVKPYRRFYLAIDDGMTPDEVLALLRREFPPGGRFRSPFVRPPSPNHMGFNLDLTDSRYDAETINLDLTDGRVSGKMYSGD